MSSSDFWALAAVVVSLVLWMNAVAWAKRRFSLDGESARKVIHMGMGCVTLAFPWLFSSSVAVIALAVIASILLVAIKTIPTLDDALRGVERESMGELYFPVGVAIVFHFARGNPVLYCPPILMLTFGDALAALIGKRYGSIQYTTMDGFKSLQGSLAFFAATAVSTSLILAILADYSWTKLLLVGLLLGVAGLILEAIAWRGLDNLFVPVFGFLLISAYDQLDAPALLPRLAMIAALVPACLAVKRRTTMDDSALLGAALALYVFWAVGDWTWMLSPLLTLVLFPLVITFDYRQFQNRQSSIALLSMISIPLLWLAAFAQNEDRALQWPFAAAFGIHLSMIWAKRANLQQRANLARLVLLGLPALAISLVTALPIAVATETFGWAELKLTVLAIVIAAAANVFAISPKRFVATIGMNRAEWLYRIAIVTIATLLIRLATQLLL